MIKIRLLDLSTMKQFDKCFETEFQKDKFIRKLKYSKKILIIDKSDNSYN